MNFASLSLNRNNSATSISLVSSQNRGIEIKEEMSAKEISDIISNSLISIVKRQFASAKEKYYKEQGNTETK